MNGCFIWSFVRASTGSGRKITERLAAHGYVVYAGARKDSDLQALGANRNVRPIRLDVTRPEDIDAAVQVVAQAGRGLYGLVNNAGIYTEAPVIDTSPEDFDLLMKVNVYEPYRVTRAFAPLIKAGHGRVVNIGPISGRLNETGAGAYQMSKHAMETFTTTLAQELAPAGVQVSVVEPGGYKSEIMRSTATRSRTLALFAATMKETPGGDRDQGLVGLYLSPGRKADSHSAVARMESQVGADT